MNLKVTYNPEIKKAYVEEGDYQIASYDFNSAHFEFEIGMEEEKADKCLELMKEEKEEWDEFESDAYDVASEQMQR